MTLDVQEIMAWRLELISLTCSSPDTASRVLGFCFSRRRPRGARSLLRWQSRAMNRVYQVVSCCPAALMDASVSAFTM